MTLTPTPTPTIDDISASTSDLHIACCSEDKFLCGRPYHPEAEATKDNHEDEACPDCVEARYRMMCPPLRPTHQHCPFKGGRWCPR